MLILNEAPRKLSNQRKNKSSGKLRYKKICSNECRINKRNMIKNFSWFEKNKDKVFSGRMAYFKMRYEIFKRDNFSCKYCGRDVENDKIKLHLDHIIPVSKGGKDIPTNLNTSCSECNLGKYDRLQSKCYIEVIKNE